MSQGAGQREDPHRRTQRDRRRMALRWLLLIPALAAALLLIPGLPRFAAAGVILAATVAALLSVGGTGGLRIERGLSHERSEAGAKIEAWLTVENPGPLPVPWLLVEEQTPRELAAEGQRALFQTLWPEQRHRLQYSLRAGVRGLYRIGPTVLETGGPFGLLRRFGVDTEARFLTVWPRRVAIPAALPPGRRPVHASPRRHSFLDDPDRFQGVRPYHPGDSPRRIHWRASARSGTFLVKHFEPTGLSGLLLAVETLPPKYSTSRSSDSDHVRSQDPDARRVQLPTWLNRAPDDIDPRQAGLWAGRQRKDDQGEDGTTPGELDPRELTITAAASLADFVLDGGQRVALLANGADAAERYPKDFKGQTFRRLDDAMQAAAARKAPSRFRLPIEVEAGRGEGHRERLHTALARLSTAPGPGLGALLSAELPRLPRSLTVAAVTPRLDHDLAEALASLRRSGIDVAVIWIRPPSSAAPSPPANLADGIPVHPIASEADLVRLGAIGL